MSSRLIDDPELFAAFLKNRIEFPPEELERHRGQWIAWAPDGTRVVAHADDIPELDRRIREAGEGPENCVFSGLPHEDTIVSRFPIALSVP